MPAVHRLGTKVLHLTKAFHGRSGYTLSLTNTDPIKTARFPKFDWPRIDVPAIAFPLEDHLAGGRGGRGARLRTGTAALRRPPARHRRFIAEPIQGEGGDNHMRAEFFAAHAQLCTSTTRCSSSTRCRPGVGTTGTAWAYQQLGVQPDIVAFAKKAQLGGIMAGGRVDEVAGQRVRGVAVGSTPPGAAR